MQCRIDELLQDSDSELEEEESKGQKKVKVKGRPEKSGKAWLKEGGEESDIVDFLDPSVSKKVIGE